MIMGWLDRFKFWRKDTDDQAPEHVDGFDVDGCFTLPDQPQPDLATSDDPDC